MRCQRWVRSSLCVRWLALLAGVALFPAPCQAQKVATLPSAAPESVSIGGAVPLFVLPQSTTPESRWALREQIGQNAVVLLFPGSGVAALDASSHQRLAEAAKSLRFVGITAALVQSFSSSTNARASSPSSGNSSALPLLLDRTGSLRRLFQLDPRATALVTIDRACFLRSVQTVKRNEGASTWEAVTHALGEASDPTPAIAEGKPAPDFMVRDMNGKAQRLRQYRGRNLLLTFFPKCFTGGCRSHLSSLQDYKAGLDASGTSVLAVSIDAAEGPKGQKAFASSLKLAFPLIPDTGRNLSILYGAAHSPEQLASRISVLIDKSGVVRWIDKQIDVKTHGADVLARITSLGLAEPSAP